MASDEFAKQLETKLPAIIKNPEFISTLQPRVMVKMYVTARNMKTANDRAAKALNAPVKKLMELLEAFLMKHLQDTGAQSLKTPDGTAFTKARRYVKVTDWEAFLAWAIEHQQGRMLKKDVSGTEISAYMEAHPDDDIPPGVSITTEAVINVHKAK